MVPFRNPSLYIFLRLLHLIPLGYVVLRMIGTVASAAAACAAVARSHIETIVQHVGNAVHIEILIGSRDLAQGGADNA